MLTRLALITLLLSIERATPLLAQDPVKESELKALMAEYATAAEKYDTAAIELIFDDNMILTSANGKYRNKQEEINDLLWKSPKLTLEYFQATDLRFVISEEVGIVKGILRWKFREQSQVELRTFTFTLAKKGNWKILAQHIGRVGS